MAKFHVTKGGKTEPCGASVRACPLGEANHFDNAQAAAVHALIEEMNQPEEAPTARDVLEVAMRNRGVNADYGTYDFNWVNTNDPADFDTAIEYLQQDEDEARQDGYEVDAEAIKRLREVILESVPRPSGN
jgi:hypothetical protein